MTLLKQATLLAKPKLHSTNDPSGIGHLDTLDPSVPVLIRIGPYIGMMDSDYIELFWGDQEGSIANYTVKPGDTAEGTGSFVTLPVDQRYIVPPADINPHYQVDTWYTVKRLVGGTRNESERLRFWSGRKNAFSATGRISPDYMCMDSTIPRKRVADILLAIVEMEKKYQLRCANVFHAGDGNLHPLILFDANDADQLHRCELFGAEILETSVAMGGTITGEHGVGVEKLNSMCVQFSKEENEQMFAVKRAFDAKGLLNPGKVIPTLNRCAEYGKMLVRDGKISHPDLPRF